MGAGTIGLAVDTGLGEGTITIGWLNGGVAGWLTGDVGLTGSVVGGLTGGAVYSTGAAVFVCSSYHFLKSSNFSFASAALLADAPLSSPLTDPLLPDELEVPALYVGSTDLDAPVMICAGMPRTT